ncbi:MAG: FUSC family protein [Solirubrobacteraceae bacterium]
MFPHLPAVLQTAAAALISWYLAVLLLPDDRPAFASIAAVVCVSVTYGQRRRRALELVGGVVLGISIATVLLYLIGSGPLQIALLVILAMTAALLFRGGELLVNEAAISAILLASLQSASAGFSSDRILEGLLGGAVGLVIASLLLPPDPVAMVSRVAQSVIGKLASTLEVAAAALAGGDVEHAEQALLAARGIDDDVDELESVLPIARDTARFSPSRRGDRDLLRRYELTMPQLDFAVRNMRVLARLVLRHARTEEPAPAGLAEAVRERADAVGELGVQYEQPERSTRLRPLALSAAQRATEVSQHGPSPVLTQIVGQVRSIAADLVRAADQLGVPGAPAWSQPTEELLAAR